MDQSWYNKVEELLNKLEPGEWFNIRQNVTPANIEAFTEMCKLRMRSSLKDKEYVFSEDMNQFKRVR
jgi:hypothetical protein